MACLQLSAIGEPAERMMRGEEGLDYGPVEATTVIVECWLFWMANERTPRSLKNAMTAQIIQMNPKHSPRAIIGKISILGPTGIAGENGVGAPKAAGDVGEEAV